VILTMRVFENLLIVAAFVAACGIGLLVVVLFDKYLVDKVILPVIGAVLYAPQLLCVAILAVVGAVLYGPFWLCVHAARIGSRVRCRLAARKAAMLVSRVRLDGGGGSPGLRASKKLARVNERVRGEVWRAFIADPDDAVWELLGRIFNQDVGHLIDAMLRDAVSPAAPVAWRAPIGAFCTRHEFVPPEPSGRALFFVLTGQAGQHRALDPDGTLLAAAYQAGSKETKAEVRQALARGGDMDLARAVLAGSRQERLARMEEDETRYLTAQFAQRQEWAGLWQLARDLPLADAVAAARLFHAGWQPAAARDRAQFGLLRRAHPGKISENCRHLPASAGQLRGPLADMTPAELADVIRRLDDPSASFWSRPFLELLRAVLTRRFGAEVALGDSRSRAEDDDISLEPSLLGIPRRSRDAGRG
jgi:hypothetical protein